MGRLRVGLLLLLGHVVLLAGCGREVLSGPVFDVHSLVGKNLPQIRAVLGTPASETPPTETQQKFADEWDLSWDKGEHTLLVTYRISDEKIINFFIATNDPGGATSDEERLLAMGNLQRDSSRYRVEFIHAVGSPGQYTGVKVVPK